MTLIQLLWLPLFVVAVHGGGTPWVQPTVGVPWPKPQLENPNAGYMVLESVHFNFTSVVHDCDILQKAYDRYYDIIFLQPPLNQTKHDPSKNKDVKYLGELKINLMAPCETLPPKHMDEMYEIKICSPDAPNEAQILSSSVWGVLRGLETFSQLLYAGEDGFHVNCTQIMDYPRFPHRGLMIDTSRHFLPLTSIFETLNLMAMNKFNVFHWHLVDDQSFPYVSSVFPNLSVQGAWSPKHTYTADEIASVIQAATYLGIRVIPEFDTPGHTESWGHGQPGLLTPCYKDGKPDGTFGPVDPSKNSSYEFMQKLFTEVTERFPDYYVHLGGDEVSFSCWQSNPEITKFMAAKNITGDYSKLEQYYVQELIDIVGNLRNKSTGYLVWQEVFDNGVKIADDTVVHVWKENSGLFKQELADVTKAGYHTLLSACWYLNVIKYGSDWAKYYECDPQDFTGTDAQKKLVMGGEACMWGEWVDATNLISRTWPRASVVAEKLWSDAKDTQDANAASPRLEEHRCRLLGRGFSAEPLGPSFCRIP